MNNYDIKVLWITWVMFPEVCSLLSLKQKVASGGWLFSSAQSIANYIDNNIAVAIVTTCVKEFTEIDGENIKYFLIPQVDSIHKYNHSYDRFWHKIINRYKPDIVHIHGTESILGLSYIRACGKNNVILSIQGIKGIIGRYYTSGLSLQNIIKNLSFRDLFKLNTIYDAQKLFKKHYKYDISYFSECDNFIGRTTWDRTHLWAVNPSANYFLCNETLRTEFYGERWSYDGCKPHTIFLSQAKDPFKGFHQILKALPLVIREFPDIELRIAGKDILKTNTLSEKLKRTGYANIIFDLIKRNDLDKHIKFLGELDAEQMKNAYLNSNVFVCTSSIENSSNSIGEAQLLGMPLIATYVGGNHDMIPSKEYGELVRFEEHEMLAFKICEIFKNSYMFDGSLMHQKASERHSSQKNTLRLIEIYQTIVSSK